MLTLNEEVNKLINKLETYKKESTKEHEMLLAQIQKEKQDFLEQTKKFSSINKSVKNIVKVPIRDLFFLPTS